MKTKIEYLESMQIEVTNASNKPRNISLTIFDAEKYQKNNFSLFGPKISLGEQNKKVGNKPVEHTSESSSISSSLSTELSSR